MVILLTINLPFVVAVAAVVIIHVVVAVVSWVIVPAHGLVVRDKLCILVGSGAVVISDFICCAGVVVDHVSMGV